MHDGMAREDFRSPSDLLASVSTLFSRIKVVFSVRGTSLSVLSSEFDSLLLKMLRFDFSASLTDILRSYACDASSTFKFWSSSTSSTFAGKSGIGDIGLEVLEIKSKFTDIWIKRWLHEFTSHKLLGWVHVPAVSDAEIKCLKLMSKLVWPVIQNRRLSFATASIWIKLESYVAIYKQETPNNIIAVLNMCEFERPLLEYSITNR